MKTLMTICITFAVLLIMSVMAGQANAVITAVSGPNSMMGTSPQIIAPPAHVLDDIVFNTGMQGFDEAQGVLTTVAHGIDEGGTISAGTLVNSHMIFLNSQGTAALQHYYVVWTFANPILGVMSDSNGTLEAASTFELGNPATNYTATFLGSGPAAPFTDRGMEAVEPATDWYTVLTPNTLEVNMFVTEPGDWIRVVTVPEPATVCLLGLGSLSLILRRRRVCAHKKG